MTQRSPSLQGQYLAAILRNVAGSTRWHVVITGIIVLIAFSWFTDRLWDVIDKRQWPQTMEWAALAVFPLLLVGMLLRARAIEKTVLPEVQCEEVDDSSAQKAACLILFLSPMNKDRAHILSLLDSTDSESRLAALRSTMQGSWRMPLEAIHVHAGRLKQIAVITSADSVGKEDGTWREFETFKRLVHRLLGNDQVAVFDASKQVAGANAKGGEAEATARMNGVDFEDAAMLTSLVHDVYQIFYRLEYKDRDIMVDITGGQKVPTIAGAAVALAEGRRFQYVSTRDYKVRHYNVTYRGL